MAEWRPLLEALSTFVVRTGQDGRHYYFCRGHESIKTRQHIRPGIDVIGDTGYVMAAGSQGIIQPYVCERDGPLVGVPAWLVEAVQQTATVQREGHPSDTWVEQVWEGVPEGQRNAMCTRLAGYLFAKKLPANVLERLLLDWAARCTPPLPEKEVRTVVASIAARESASFTAEIVEIGEPLPSFAERMKAQPPRPMLVENLILADGITLLHGQPRAGKSLALAELLLAISTGTPAFGLGSLTVAERLPVMYVTEEDPPVKVAERLEEMCKGRGLSSLPQLFRLSVAKGLSIDDPSQQGNLIETVRRYGIRVVAFDPLRSLTAHADQGPAELVPVVNFLRRLQRETGCAVLLGHHDTKLPLRRDDSREPPHRISGGGLFGIADTPIHVRRESDTPFRSVLTPSHCKFFSDPPAIRYTLHVEEGGYRLVGEHNPVTTAEDVETREHGIIIRFLTEQPGSSNNAVVNGIKKGRPVTFERLKALAAKGRIVDRGTGRTKAWFVVPSSPVGGSNGSGGSRTVPEPLGAVGSMVPPPKRREPRTDPSTNGQNRPAG